MKQMSGKRSASPDRRILFDGWPLAYAPGSPAALHLLELIEALPAPYEPWLVVPVEIEHPHRAVLARADVSLMVKPHDRTHLQALRWEQKTLPAALWEIKACVLHTTRLRLPLVCPAPVVVSPAEDRTHTAFAGNFTARLRDSLARGGLAGARAILWPNDLPEAGVTYAAPIWRVPPHVHSAFLQPQSRPPGLPDDYVLACGLTTGDDLEYLAAAWSWASAGLGDDCALLALNLSPEQLNTLRGLCEAAGAAGPVRSGHVVSPAEWAGVFQHARVVVHVGAILPWADGLLQAVASGRPLVTAASWLSDARVGPAGYLTPAGDARAMGAAILSLIVEESLTEELSRAARERAAGWHRLTFADTLAEIYERALT